MDNHDKPKFPTLTIQLKNPLVFHIEVNLGGCSLALTRAMLNEAVKSIDSAIADQEALTFQKKMVQAAYGAGATQKKPSVS